MTAKSSGKSTVGKSSSKRTAIPTKPCIGLALAGGGPLGAVYEIKLSVLSDTSLTLVKNPPSGKRARFAIADLNETLDRLERYLKVAAT